MRDPGVEWSAIFVTWRLAGSLPEHARRLCRRIGDSGEMFREMDRLLDAAAMGPLWLGVPEVASEVCDTAARSAPGSYELYAYVVMANHIHLVLRPLIAIDKVSRNLKTLLAQRANHILGRRGERFWETESFEHRIRDEWEYRRIVKYVERNPVTAKLVEQPEDWLWSSARQSSYRREDSPEEVLAERGAAYPRTVVSGK